MNTMNAMQQNQTEPVQENKRCAFCWPSEHGKHGDVKREWSVEWTMFIPVCRKHAQELGDVNTNLLAERHSKVEPNPRVGTL